MRIIKAIFQNCFEYLLRKLDLFRVEAAIGARLSFRIEINDMTSVVTQRSPTSPYLIALKASSESTGGYRANGVPVHRGNTGGLLLLKWVWRLREAARKSGWKVYSRQGSLSGAINCQKR